MDKTREPTPHICISGHELNQYFTGNIVERHKRIVMAKVHACGDCRRLWKSIAKLWHYQD